MKSIETVVAEVGPLVFLSFQRTRRGEIPAAPSNEDRMRAFRSTQPVLHGNNYEWQFRNAELQTAG